MTVYIVIITVLVSLAAFSNRQLMSKLIFNPYLVSHRKEWYRFITSGFIHADGMHLFFNMFVFFSFGTVVEGYYGDVFPVNGTFYFILLYLGGLVISIAPTYAKHKDNYSYNALGASGAVSSVLFTAILFNPLAPVYIFNIIKLPGVVAGVGYLIAEYYLSKKGADNVNHDAHIWGAIFGLVYTIGLKPILFLEFFQNLMNFGK